MKKLLVFLYFVSIPFIVPAKVSITVNVPYGGSLSSSLRALGCNVLVITNLTVTGNIDARDVFFMRDSMPVLATLNLKSARINTYSYYPANKMPDSSFFYAATLQGKTTLNKIIFPTGITSIGNSSIRGCSGLSGHLSIPNYVTSIGDFAFYGCSGFKGNLTIPDLVTSIGQNAFANCTGFKGKLKIPNSVVTIGDYAFSGCSGFHGNLNLPSSLTSIGRSTFNSCNGFKGSLTIPNSVTSVGAYAFFSCSGFKGGLTIPYSVTSIGDYAFYSCSGFKGTLVIPGSVTSIGNYTFYGCTGFSKILVSKIIPIPISSATFSSSTTNTCSLIVPYGSKHSYQADPNWGLFVNIIEGIPVVSFNSLGGSHINDTIVDTIHMIWVQQPVKAGFSFGGWYKEAACTNAWKYATDTIKANLTLYAKWVKINSVNNLIVGNLGNTVKTISLRPDTLQQLTITGKIDARDVKFMRDSMPLLSVLDLTGVRIIAYAGQLGTNPGYTSYAANELPSNSFSPLVASILLSNLRYIKFPASLKSIGKNAFLNCSNLTGTLILPDSLEKIKYGAFKNCAGLTGSLTLPNSIDSIGAYAFQKCTGFSGSLTLSNSLITVDSFAFYGCTQLTENLYIPASVRTIGNLAFFNCYHVVSITVSADSKNFDDIDGVLYNSAKSELLVCPPGNNNISYRIPGSVTKIDACAFYNCNNLSGNIIIPNTTTTIGDSAFFNCSAIDTINVPASLTSPTNLTNVFYNCSNLSLVIATAATPINISASTFYNVNTSKCGLLVPNASTTLYQTALYWKSFKKTNINGATFVEFETNGGLAIAPLKANLKSLIIAPADSTEKDGYSFAGWYKDVACNIPWNFSTDVVTADITLYAKWNINSYNVSFNTNGGNIIADTTINYNVVVPMPANPTQTGYTFAGWYKEAACKTIWNFASDVVTSDMILFSKWTINSYAVSFNSNGGSVIGNISANYNTAITSPSAPLKTGFTFVGWYKDTAFSTLWNFTSDLVTSNITLFAKWVITSFTVTFNSNGGSLVGNVVTNINTKLTEPSAPNKKGYTFAGWYKEVSCTNSWNFGSDVITSDTTLYAKWNINSYKVGFNTNGGTLIADTTVTVNSKITIPKPPIKNGYTFAGWYKQGLLTNTWNFVSEVVSSDTILFAKWNINTYMVKFNTNGGSSITNISANYYSTIVAPANPSKQGYSFNGWYKDAAFTNAWNFASDTIKTDTTLYANWNINLYRVSFNTNGGSLLADTTVNYASTINSPKSPIKQGYTFAGWYTEPACNNLWYFPTYAVSSNTTLYAKWNINSYTVSFNSNKGTIISDTIVKYKAKVNTPKAPIRKGYSLSGWYKDSTLANEWNFSSDTVISNITLFAKWIISTYTVSFNTKGGSPIPNVLANYNTTITAPNAPSQTGYNFAGWYKDATCINVWNFTTDTITSNGILYAKWIIITYTVSFNTNGGNPIPNVLANYNTTITAPNAPVLADYNFAGWYKEATCINQWNFATDTITSNVILYAKWIKVTGTNNGIINYNIYLYPNPASDKIEIGGIAMQQINIYNLLGRDVVKVNTNGIDKVNITVSGLEPGIYYVRIKTSENETKVLKLQKR